MPPSYIFSLGTNIQKQQDAPFLLSLSGGQVAQYFNKTVRLDVIDKVLSNAESKRRKASQELKQTEELLNGFEQRKNEYCWLNAVEKLIAKYDNITSKKNKNCRKFFAKINQKKIWRLMFAKLDAPPLQCTLKTL